MAVVGEERVLDGVRVRLVVVFVFLMEMARAGDSVPADLRFVVDLVEERERLLVDADDMAKGSWEGQRRSWWSGLQQAVSVVHDRIEARVHCTDVCYESVYTALVHVSCECNVDRCLCTADRVPSAVSTSAGESGVVAVSVSVLYVSAVQPLACRCLLCARSLSGGALCVVVAAVAV